MSEKSETMMSAHTPGPWKHGLASNCILGADGTEVVELPQGADPEAEIWWEHERANARLIAAAPSYAKAWSMVPAEIRERILSAIDWRDAEAIDRAEGKS